MSAPDGTPFLFFNYFWVKYDVDATPIVNEISARFILLFADYDTGVAVQNKYDFRVLYELSVDNFSTIGKSFVLENQWFGRYAWQCWDENPLSPSYQYSGIGSIKTFPPSQELGYIKEYSISSDEVYTSCPFAGTAYKIRATLQYKTKSGSWQNSYYNSYRQVYDAAAPIKIDIQAPSTVYGNAVNTFAASIPAGVTTKITGKASSNWARNDGVRNANWPYITSGTATSLVYWFPQIPCSYKPGLDGDPYVLKIEMSIPVPGHEQYSWDMGYSSVTGTISFLETDAVNMFSATTEIVDPSGLYDEYGVLLRNTDATVVRRATVTPSYGATMTIADKKINESKYDPIYGYGYSTVYEGPEPYSFEIEELVPASGTVANTGIKAFGYVASGAEPIESTSVSWPIISYYIPAIPTFTARRCDEDGTPNDLGEYCKIDWSVSICPIADQNSKRVVIRHSAGTTEVTPPSYNYGASLIVAASTESSYTLSITAYDDLTPLGFTKSRMLSTGAVIMDFMDGGKAIGLGKVSELAQSVEINALWQLICYKLVLGDMDLSTWLTEVERWRAAVNQFLNNAASGQHRVTFYNNGEFYDEQWVLTGDDADDPVDKGYDAPTKAPTETITYGYAGWTLDDPPTSVNPNALLNITDDRAIYAVYTSGTRYYTVRYINGETTVSEQTNIQYPGNANQPTNPTSETLLFGGWSPSGRYIEDGEDCIAQWWDDSEITQLDGETVVYGDWDTFIADCESGLAPSKYAIGQYLPMTLDDGNDTVINMRIIGFKVDERADRKRKAAVTMLGDQLYSETHSYNPTMAYEFDTDTGPSWECYDYYGENETTPTSTEALRIYYKSRNYETNTTATATFKLTIIANPKNVKTSGYATIKYGNVDGGNVNNILTISVNGTQVVSSGGTGTYVLGASPNWDIPIGTEFTVEVAFEMATNTDANDYSKFVEFEGTSQSYTTACWVKVELLSANTVNRRSNRRFETGTGTIGGYPASEIRSYYNSTILPQIPENIRKHIKPVKKYSAGYQPDGTVREFESTEYVCPPGYAEEYGCIAGEVDGFDCVRTSARRIRKKGTTSTTYLLRSAATTNNEWCTSSSGTSTNSGSATVATARGLPIMFSI